MSLVHSARFPMLGLTMVGPAGEQIRSHSAADRLTPTASAAWHLGQLVKGRLRRATC